MDAKVILVLLILSHIVADFIWQDDAMAEKKKTCTKTMFRHSLNYLITNIVLLSPYLDINNNLWWVILLLSLAHWTLDMCKVEFDKRKKDNGLESFLFDQVAHFILIGSCYPFIKDIEINPFAHSLSSFLVHHYPLFVYLTSQKIFVGIAILAGYIFNFKGATVITKKVLDKYLHLKKDEPIKENEKNAGEAIGILERILILTLVLQQNYAAIGLVIAGKTIARYKKLEEKNFAEYFLIGTFTSIIIAFLIGVFIQAVILLQ